MPNGARALAKKVAALLPSRTRVIRLYGLATFRPGDEIHEVLRAEAEGEVLVLHLEDPGGGQSTLRVWSPAEASVQPGEFSLLLRIDQAARVAWETPQGLWTGQMHGARVLFGSPGREASEVEEPGPALELQ